MQFSSKPRKTLVAVCSAFLGSCGGQLVPLWEAGDPTSTRRIDACDGVDCSNHGTCQDIGGIPRCSCDEGYQNNSLTECAIQELFVKQCNEYDWCDMSVGIEDTLQSIWGFSKDNIWAVGDQGTILYFDGVKWTQQESNTTAKLWDVWGSGPQDVWAVGRQGTLLHYDGTTWRDISIDSRGIMRSVWGLGKDDIWTFPIIPSFDAQTLNCTQTSIHFDGSKWAQVYSENACQSILNVWGHDSDDIWAVGCEVNSMGYCTRGTQMHWDGISWTKSDKNPSLFFTKIDGIAYDSIWAVGCRANEYGSCYWGVAYRFDGTQWVLDLPEAAVDILLGVWVSEAGRVWVVGRKGLILHRRDDRGWWRITSGHTNELTDIWGVGQHLWAVGEKGTILYHRMTEF